ncbi:hypothetical protein G6730_00030 [Polynucleobacter paneuropaeus]|nr:hypothetical protein [Polynucleobacter paneuropaeus]
MDELLFHIDNASENLEGWIFHKGGKKVLLKVVINGATCVVEPILPRHDVYAKYGVLLCGFSLHLGAYMGSLSVVVVAEAEELSLQIYNKIVNDSNRTKSLEVALGYHFLTNDSNKTRDMLKNGRAISEHDLLGNISALEGLSQTLTKSGIIFGVFVIPEKNHVLKFLEPTFSVSDNRIAYALAKSKAAGYCYFLDFLINLSIEDRLAIYSKGDNHINFLGIQKIIEKYFQNGIKSFKACEIKAGTQIGDLSRKIDQTYLVDLDGAITIQDNTEYLIKSGMQLTGSEIKSRNPKAPSSSKLFILGTSSARNFLYSLSPSFSSIDMMWGTSVSIKKIIAEEYSHFYFIIPERLLYDHTLQNLNADQNEAL